MGREIDTGTLSPLGRVVVDWCSAQGISLTALESDLGWPSRRIYRIIRADSVDFSDVARISDVTGIPLERFTKLDQRKHERSKEGA